MRELMVANDVDEYIAAAPAAARTKLRQMRSIPDGLKKELGSYKTGRGSVLFPLDRPLPVTLVARLVRARVKANEERA